MDDGIRAAPTPPGTPARSIVGEHDLARALREEGRRLAPSGALEARILGALRGHARSEEAATPAPRAEPGVRPIRGAGVFLRVAAAVLIGGLVLRLFGPGADPSSAGTAAAGTGAAETEEEPTMAHATEAPSASRVAPAAAETPRSPAAPRSVSADVVLDLPPLALASIGATLGTARDSTLAGKDAWLSVLGLFGPAFLEDLGEDPALREVLRSDPLLAEARHLLSDASRAAEELVRALPRPLQSLGRPW